MVNSIILCKWWGAYKFRLRGGLNGAFAVFHLIVKMFNFKIYLTEIAFLSYEGFLKKAP